MSASSIGPFEIIGSLGAGPRGSVYRARRVDHGRIVAIKQLSAGLTSDSPEFTRLWNEVARLRAVVSNHVATTYSVELIDGRPVIEMESLGESLEKATSTRPLGLREGLHAVRDILAGLKVLHDAGIGHGNLKPSNVLQDTTTGSWKLSDGGTTAIEAQTTPTLLATSVLYAAPEMLLGQAEGGERSDLYSVGMMGLEAVLGGEGLGAAFPQVSNLQSPSRWLTWLEDSTREALPLREIRPETPESVSHFFSRLLAKNSDGRFASAFAATVELEAILPQLPSTTSDMPTYSGVADAPTLLVAPPQGSKARLLITGPKGFDQKLELSDRTYRIGRDAQNDIVLPDETKAVSRIHAELTRDGERYVLTDLDSQNGLWVNGRRKPTVQLQPGVPVKIGGYTVTFSTGVVAAETNQKAAKPAPAKPAPVKTRPAQSPAQTGGARLAMSGVIAAASRFGSTVRTWWPPKNAQQWAAVGSVAAVLVAGVLWIAFRNPPPAVQSGPGRGETNANAGNVTTTTPPVTTVLTAPEESINKVRELISKADYEGASSEIEILSTLYPEDKKLQELKQQAVEGLAKLRATQTATPTPVASAAQKTPAPVSRGRRGTQPTATVTPVLPEKPKETEADKLKRALEERDFARAFELLVEIQKANPRYPGLVQATMQIGKAAERANDLLSATKLFKLVHDLAPGSEEARGLTRDGEQALKDALDDVDYPKYKERAVEGLKKAIRYLPDSLQSKKTAQEALAKISK